MAQTEDEDKKAQVWSLLMANSTNANMELPEFNRLVPHSFFALFDMFMKINKITDANMQLQCLIRKIPTDILLILEPIISDQTLTDQARFDKIKNEIFKHLHKGENEMLDYYLTFRKREDHSFSSFLRTLKSIAKACNKENDKELLKHRFMCSVKDDMHVSIARTMLLNEDLDNVAKALDNLPERKEVHAVNVQTDNHKLENLSLLVENLASRIENLSKDTRAIKEARDRDTNRQNNNWQRKNSGHGPDPNTYAAYKQQANRAQPQTFNHNGAHNYGRNHTQYTHTNTSRRDMNVCYYHDRFGSFARKCDPQCKFFRKN